VHTGSSAVNLWERDYLQDPGVDVNIILKRIFRRWDGGMEWIDPAQNRGRWWSLINAVMNLWVP
jgi:hypothetical protein